MSKIPLRLLGPWRRFLQASAVLTLLVIPFIRVKGESLLRLDLGTLSLHACGEIFRIEELHVFLFLGIALLLLFLLITLLLGRAWCGWACPQTTLTDLVEGFARMIGVQVHQGRITASAVQKGVLHLFYLAIALLSAVNLVWYFVSPYDFFPRLMASDLPRGTFITLAVVGVIVYVNLAFVRRLACLEFCPYGRFQAALIDQGTLVLQFHPDEAARCIRCNACVRACPVGIDIRQGFQVECINCARCLDACRQVMTRRGQKGIIRYTFGLQNRGFRALINIRTALVVGALLLVSAAVIQAMLTRPQAVLKVERTPGATSRLLPDGTAVTFFTAYLTNRQQQEQTFSLAATLADGTTLELKGQTRDLSLPAGARRRLDFVVTSPRTDRTLAVLFTVRDGSGNTVAEAGAFLTPLQE